METFRVKHHCPYCGKPHNLASQLNREDYGKGPPEPGNLMLCIKCGEVGMFDGGRLRKPTVAELIDIDGDQNVADMRRAWQLMVKETGGVP